MISIIVPMYNEEEVIDIFFEKIEAVLNTLDEDFEIICIDDGSTDGTFEKLEHHSKRNSAIKIIEFSRNFGKENAMTAGLDYCKGDAAIPIDTDLQDPPEKIKEFVEKWRQGYEVVYGTRVSRDTDRLMKRSTASMFYEIYNKLSEATIPENAGDFRLIDRSVINAIKALPEKNRFMKGIFAWVGFSQTSVPYVRQSRAAGTTKWNYWKLWNYALDGITGFSTVPLRLWSYIGATVALFAFIYALFLIVRTLVYGVDLPGYASLMVVVLMLGGIQLLTLGIMGEYIGRLYKEVKNRPNYIVRRTKGLD